jgi:hypothetical protein
MRSPGGGVSSDEESAARTSARREARLKPEFAHLYPPVEAGRWESAAKMADRVVAWLLRQPDKGYVAPERVLRSEHFDFRGGTEQTGSRQDANVRRNSLGQR